MKPIRWSLTKNAELKRKRGVSFEEIMRADLLEIMEHPKRANQRVMLFEHKNYIWVVPFVDRGDQIFLKTLFPSRKFTKLWKDGKLPWSKTN